MASTKFYSARSIACGNYRSNNSLLYEGKFDWQLLVATLVTIAFYMVTFVEIAREIEYEEATRWQSRTELPGPIA